MARALELALGSGVVIFQFSMLGVLAGWSVSIGDPAPRVECRVISDWIGPWP